MSEGLHINLDDLGLPATPDLRCSEENINLRQVRDTAEYQVMVKALARAGGNIMKAAELLGVSRPTLYDLMNHHGIK
jgi:transcriptional regulator of acetoin/glycerol metabolism